MLDARQGENEGNIHYWLKIIQSFGGDAPVIVVSNKTDQHPLDLDRRGLQEKYPTIRAFVETVAQTVVGSMSFVLPSMPSSGNSTTSMTACPCRGLR